MPSLVTGGFGFLGSHLVDHLQESGDEVFVVDNLQGSPLPLGTMLDLMPMGRHLRYAIANVAEFCDAEPPRGRFETIYHLASPVGPAGVLSHAGTLASTILRDAMAVARLGQRTGARVVFASTSEVYGGGDGGECREDSPGVIRRASARAEYAAGKLAADIAIQNLVAAKQLDAVIVRPFNIAGPRQSGRGGFVLPRFVAQALAGRPLTVFGDGRQRRAFGHVKDIAAAFALAARRGLGGAVYNAGNPANQSTIRELAEEVVAATESRSRIECVDPASIHGPAFAEAEDKYPAPGDGLHRLGWVPTRDRRTVVADTVAFMRRLPADLVASLAGARA